MHAAVSETSGHANQGHRVLMVSTSYPAHAQDWRGRFIHDMAASLGAEADLRLSLWSPPGEPPKGVSYVAGPESAWLDALQRRGGIAQALRRGELGTILGLLRRLRRAYRRELPRCDLVHVNWLQNALPLANLKTPLLLSVLGADFGLLRLPGMRAALRVMLRQRPVILAPNAGWMAAPLEQTFGDLARIRPIPFGVDEGWFQVERRPDTDAPREWLAVTRLTRNKIGDLFNWGEGLFDAQRQLHLFGPMQESQSLPPWVRYHGPTHPTVLREQWFPRASGLLTLSRHSEGRPQVLLEAMAAGLPVIVSDLPAHRDVVLHGETGWIAGNRAMFAEALDQLDDPASNQLLGTAARRMIRATMGTWTDCARRLKTAYLDLLREA